MTEHISNDLPADNADGVANVLTHDEQERVRIMADHIFNAARNGYPTIRTILAESILRPDDELGQLVVRTTDAPDPATMTYSDAVPTWLEITYLEGCADDSWGSLDEGDDFHAYRVLHHIVTTNQAGHQGVTTYATQCEAEVAFIVSNVYQQYR